jgi:hypothetical protein
VKAKEFVLVSVLMFSGCTLFRSSTPPLMPLVDDPSIAFPQFTDRVPVMVGAEGAVHELDGAMLRALMVATHDFLPPEAEDLPCARTREAQSYRVITQGDVFFISISENTAHCGHTFPALDSGARYAISREGKILRRRLDGQPEFPRESPTPDDATWIEAAPGVAAPVESPGTSAPDGGTPPLPDADGGDE